MTSWVRDMWELDDSELKPALALAMSLSHASMGALMLREKGNGAMRIVVSEGLSTDEEFLFGTRVTSLHSIDLACAEHRRIAIRDAYSTAEQLDPAIRDLARQMGFRGLEVMPLERNGAAALGALTLFFRAPHRLTTRVQRLTTLATTIIALALDNCRLRAEAEEKRRVAEQRAYDRLQFLARINHELRTPLQSITGYVELLKQGADVPTQRQRQMLERIEHSEQVLLGIIDDVANLGRIEAGRMSYTLTAVPVGDVMSRVAAVVEPIARRQQVTLRVEPPGGLVVAHADRGKLTQILINLVTNAVKFSPAGGQVSAVARRWGSRIDFVVQDDGPGIPVDKLSAIFEPYVQLERRSHSHFNGFGLGLAISREFAEGMGGRLVAHSDPQSQRGSTFTLSLRAHRPDRPLWRSHSPVVRGDILVPDTPNTAQH